MRLIHDVADAVRAGSLTAGAFLLPVGLGLLDVAGLSGAYAAEGLVVMASEEREAVVWIAEPEAEPAPAAPPVASGTASADGASSEALSEPAEPQVGRADVQVVSPRGPARDRRTSATEPEAPAKKQGKRCDPEPKGGIERVSGSTFAVERDLVSYYATHLKALDALGSVHRHEGSDGKTDGFRVVGIRCGNDLYRAGLRNGDVVHTVNGRKVTSIPEALLAYTQLKRSEVIELRISRRGEARTLTYHLS